MICSISHSGEETFLRESLKYYTESFTMINWSWSFKLLINTNSLHLHCSYVKSVLCVLLLEQFQKQSLAENPLLLILLVLG